MSCVLIINIKISYFFLPRRKINVPSLESLSLFHSKHSIFIEWKPIKNYWVIKWWLLIKKFFFFKTDFLFLKVWLWAKPIIACKVHEGKDQIFLESLIVIVA